MTRQRETLCIELENAVHTERFGAMLAGSLPAEAPCQSLLLEGALGAGKTTLARGLVAALPGGDEAEFSSPSFNVLNLYPTEPPVAHFDLYRLENQPPDEGLLECIESGTHLLLIEWPQFLPRRFWPASYVLLRWPSPESADARGRLLELESAGEYAAPFWTAIRRAAAIFLRR